MKKPEQYQSDFTKILLKEGIGSFLFLAPMRRLRHVFGVFSYTSSSDPEEMVPCRIIESRHKVEDDYKITLEPIYEGFEKRHYYVSDLTSFIRRGSIQLFVNKSIDV